MKRSLPVLLLLAGCEPVLSTQTEQIGALPPGFDVEQLGDVPVGTFVLVGEPGSTEVAVLQSAERGTFTAVGSATCTDCGDATCSGGTHMDRTLSVDVIHDSGTGLELVEVVEASSENFTNPSSFTFTPVDGAGQTINVTGTLSTCAPFSYRFTLETVLPPLGATLPFLEDFEDAAVGYVTPQGEHGRTTQDYFRRTDGSDISPSFGIPYTGYGGTSFFAAEDLDDDGRSVEQYLHFAGIDISGATRPVVSLKAGAGNATGYELQDVLRVQASVDGGTPVDLLAFVGGGAMSEVNRDTVLTKALRTFSAPLPFPGSTLDLRITMKLSAENEELAIDDVMVQDDPGRTVFVTSSAHTGNLGGLDGADEICQSAAENAGLPGLYQAWLATSNADQPAARFDQRGSFELVDGTVLATSWTDLTDGTLADAIYLDENGAETLDAVWTNVWEDGSAGGSLVDETCDGFTSASDANFSILGFSLETSTWSADDYGLCDQLASLYCFEQ